MTYHWTIPLIAALANFGLGVVVWRTAQNTSTVRVFTFLSLTLVFWNLNFFVMYAVSDRVLAFELTRVFRAVAMLLPPAILHTSLALSGGLGSRARKVLVCDYALGVALFVANCFDLLVSDLGVYDWGFYSIGTPLYHVFTFSVVANFLGATGLMYYKYSRTSEPRTRLQLKFWLLGSAVSLPLGLTNLLPSYGVPIYPLGNMGSVVWAGVVAYAIVRHRLMDIDLVLTRGVSYAIVSAVVILPTFLGSLWLQQRSFGQIHTDFSFAILLMFLGVGVLFPSVRRRTQTQLERSFFPEKEESRSALLKFTRTIVMIFERDRLIASTAETLSRAFDVDRLAIALTGEGQANLAVCRTIGVPPTIGELELSHPFVESLARRQDAVLSDELSASKNVTERGPAAELCRANGWEVAVPLMVGGKLTGFIGLGRKRNLDPFYVEDLEILATVAAEASIALENCRLYEELKRSQDIIRRADRLSALGTLAAGIAHEIRNPLVSIQTFFQLAPQRLNDQEFLTEFLNLTSSEVKRITDLITELLSFARSPTTVTSEVDLNGLLDGVSRLVEPQLRKEQIRVTKTFSADLPMTRADRDQLKQVLLNVMLNAAQATGAGGEIRLSSRQVMVEGRRYCQLEIADTGRGIPTEVIDDIFNPFFTTKDKGTGLGLAIANQVIAEHGGFIAVDSTVDVGTTFRVHLRAHEESESDSDRFPVVEAVERRASGIRPRFH